jgi:secreted trypsin-like serine protease
MKAQALFCLILISSTLAVPVVEDRESRIVGGVNAIPGESPFIVSLHWVLLTLSTHVCGGSIINNVWVLSAAHCLTEVPQTGRLEIIAGLHSQANLGEGSRIGINRPASILHPDWVKKRFFTCQ